MLIFFLIPEFKKHPKLYSGFPPETFYVYTSIFYSLHFYLHRCLIKLPVMPLFCHNAKNTTACHDALSRKLCCCFGGLGKGGCH